MADETRAEIGVFGGSGFYSLIEGAREEWIETPYGAPSDKVALGEIAGRRVAFLPRHGKDHRFPPQAINYRANLWAMKRLGVKWIIGPTAAGSLAKGVRPGSMVVADQLVDRTSGRKDTFYDGPDNDARQLRRPVLPDASPDRDRSAQRPRRRDPRARHRRRDPRAAFLDALGVEVVPEPGLGGHQHDAISRDVFGARARNLLRQHLAHHRLTTSGSKVCRPSPITKSSKSSIATTSACATRSARSSRRFRRCRLLVPARARGGTFVAECDASRRVDFAMYVRAIPSLARHPSIFVMPLLAAVVDLLDRPNNALLHRCGRRRRQFHIPNHRAARLRVLLRRCGHRRE